MICVIGSGPAGAACASALASRGRHVTLLDSGVQIEAPRRMLAERLRKTANWSPEDFRSLKGNVKATAKGLPLKLLFGSDFPYRDADTHLPPETAGIGIRPSFAFGGLSNVWGAAMLPYNDRDLAGWPVKTAALAPHYDAVAALTKLTGSPDDGIAKLFPVRVETLQPLKPSRQAEAFLRDMEKDAGKLGRNGLIFGKSRVAVTAVPGEPNACVYCGLCMHGCVYDSIYNSASTIRELENAGSLTYRNGFVVTKLSEEHGLVKVCGRRRESGECFEMEAERVFLAAGVLPTTQILLESLGAYDRPLEIKDSQYFLFPLLRFVRTPGVAQEKLNALSQVFIEILDPAVNPFTVHLQVYSFDDLIPQAIAAPFGPLRHPLRFLIENLAERMLIVQGYLHSDFSSTISVTLGKPAAGTAAQLILTPKINAETKPAIRRVMRKMARHAGSLRALPLVPMLKIADPGRGFHSGGTFPMCKNPGEFECDPAGRPTGFEKVHVVDASVFPSIPATTIAFSVMANAHRIATEFAQE